MHREGHPVYGGTAVRGPCYGLYLRSTGTVLLHNSGHIGSMPFRATLASSHAAKSKPHWLLATLRNPSHIGCAAAKS